MAPRLFQDPPCQQVMLTETSMNERPQQLSRCIDDRLAEIIRQITDARNAFTSVGQHVNWAVEVKLEQIRTRTSARNGQFQKERERVNSKVKRVLANAVSPQATL